MRTQKPPVEDIASELDRLRCRVAELEDELALRQRAEKALRASERKYRMLVESSPSCIKLIDDEGRLLSMNKAGLRMLGEEAEAAIIGRHYLKVVSVGDLERVTRLLERALAGEYQEYEFVSTGGRDFSSCFVPIRDDAGAVTNLLCITEDATDRNKAIEGRRAGEERFRLVSLATRDAIYDWDLRTGVVWRNRVYQEVYGVNESTDATAMWWESHIHPDDHERLLSSLRGGGRWRWRSLGGGVPDPAPRRQLCQRRRSGLDRARRQWQDDPHHRRHDGYHRTPRGRAAPAADDQRARSPREEQPGRRARAFGADQAEYGIAGSVHQDVRRTKSGRWPAPTKRWPPRAGKAFVFTTC